MDWWGGSNYQTPFGERSKGRSYRIGDTIKEIHLAKDQMAYLAEQIQWRTPIRERVMEFNGHTIHYFRLKGFFQLFFGGMFERFEDLIIHFWVIMSFLVILLPRLPR